MYVKMFSPLFTRWQSVGHHMRRCKDQISLDTDVTTVSTASSTSMTSPLHTTPEPRPPPHWGMEPCPPQLGMEPCPTLIRMKPRPSHNK